MPITLFENITEDLTDYEKNELVPMLVDTLRFKTATNKVSTRNICGWFKASGVNMTPVRVRKMVAYIRQMQLVAPNVVIGSNDGYYLSNDPCEIQQQIDSLRQRARKINQAADSIAAQLSSLKLYKKGA